MPYCTIDDVATAVGGPDRLLQLSDLANDGVKNARTDAVVMRAIAEADGEIDMAIGHRFSVTELHAKNPEPLQFKSAAWAARVLRRFAYNGQPMPDDLEHEKMDREWLKQVATGLVSIGIEPYPGPASIVNDKFGTRDSMKSVSRAKLKGSW